VVKFSIRIPLDVVSTKRCLKDNTQQVHGYELLRHPEVVREEMPR
jgi:hypothetical protein